MINDASRGSSELSRVQRELRVWRTLALLIPVGIVLMAAGVRLQEPSIIGFAGANDRVYRFWSDGSIEYLVPDSRMRTKDGVPDWTPVLIDDKLHRSPR